MCYTSSYLHLCTPDGMPEEEVGERKEDILPTKWRPTII
jgi:hypothetical protein